jgi:hypothetical protein
LVPGVQRLKGNHPKFLVTYLAPASVIEEWKKTDPENRKAAEKKCEPIGLSG